MAVAVLAAVVAPGAEAAVVAVIAEEAAPVA